MSTFPGSPRLLRGAIIGIDIMNPVASAILFQYNPESLTRSLQPQGAGNESGDRAEPMRLRGAPVETIKLEVEIDATDQLESGGGHAGSLGIYPQLSQLEMLIYPKSPLIIANTALMFAGTLEIIPPMGAMTFLVWGFKRVLPVRITELSITEEAHDPKLNPIRAKVSLGLRVLSYNDLSVLTPGYHVFLAHQIVKETMAVLATASNAASVVGGDINLRLV
jgi:hypothetical protein